MPLRYFEKTYTSMLSARLEFPNMIELCHDEDELPVYHVTETDTPELYTLITFNHGHSNPEIDEMAFVVAREEECEEVLRNHFTGRAGLLRWYQANVENVPDPVSLHPTPIENLIERVASHLMLRAASA